MSDWFWKKLSFLSCWASILTFLGWVVFASNIEIKDLDLWLHLAAGRFIFEHGFIPQTDVLSCTVAGQPWINHEWLFQVIAYVLYQNLGFDGLTLMQVLVVGTTFAFLLFHGYDKKRLIIPVILLILAFKVYELRLTIRPDIFSLLFFVLFVHVLSFHLHSRWASFVLLALQVLWVNIHGFFILGPLIALMGYAAEGIKRHVPLPFEWNNTGRLSDDEYRRIRFIFVLITLGCFFNPATSEGALYPLKVLFSLSGDSQIFFEHIKELERPFTLATFFSWEGYPYYKLLVVLSILSFVLNFRRIDIGAVLLWLVVFLISAKASRNIIFFALAAYFIILNNAQYILAQKNFRNILKNKKIRHLAIVLVNVSLVLAMAQYLQKMNLRGYFDFDRFERKSEFGGVSLRNFAYKAVDFLEANQVRGNFFNDFNSGSYLLGRVHPNIKVFIDGRTEVYGARFFNKYRKILAGDTKLLEEAVNEYHLTGAFLNYVYVPTPAKTISYFYNSKQWKLVYFDYDAAIFLKDVPFNKPWISRFAIDLSKWQVPKNDLFKIGVRRVTPYQNINRANALYNMGFPKKALEEAENALKIAPNDSEAYELLGRIHNDQKEYARAYEDLRKSLLFNPNNNFARYLLAFSLYHLGDYDEAEAQSYQVLSRDPGYNNALFLLALIYAKTEKYDKLMEVLIDAQQSDSASAADQTEDVGDILFSLKKFEQAREVYSLIAKKRDAEKGSIAGKIEDCTKALKVR